MLAEAADGKRLIRPREVKREFHPYIIPYLRCEEAN